MIGEIPQTFIQWAYHERAALIQRQVSGESVPPHEIFLGFSRHTPAVVSNGPAGLNASIKGVGFLPKAEYIEETLAVYQAHILKGWSDTYSAEGLQILMRYLYGSECLNRIDFTRLGTLEIARDHTWNNLRAHPVATILFYQPPMVSYELRGGVEIHEPGSLYHQLLNAQHDVYHQPHPERWEQRPAYVFTVEEIYNNSASREGFGRQIYP